MLRPYGLADVAGHSVCVLCASALRPRRRGRSFCTGLMCFGHTASQTWQVILYGSYVLRPYGLADVAGHFVRVLCASAIRPRRQFRSTILCPMCFGHTASQTWQVILFASYVLRPYGLADDSGRHIVVIAARPRGTCGKFKSFFRLQFLFNLMRYVEHCSILIQLFDIYVVVYLLVI